MIVNAFQNNIKELATKYLVDIESHFGPAGFDALFYYGTIQDNNLVTKFRRVIEDLIAKNNEINKTLIIILHTGGGSIEATAKFVKIIRNFYNQVFFIIPDFAMSAGTVFSMSGDKIYMDYSSCLGPIDPQIFSNKEQRWVPANGYLNMFDDLMIKARANTITMAEVAMLQSLDFAFLNHCRNIKEVSNKLLQEWLVKYKFKDWNNHRDGRIVTEAEKITRASEIALNLGDNLHWKTHSRPIHISDLVQMRLKIEDYSQDENLKNVIRKYTDFMLDYIQSIDPNCPNFIHTKHFI
jgi:hypothetical protein